LTPLSRHRDPEFGANRPFPLGPWVAASSASIEGEWLVYPLKGLREIDSSTAVLDPFLALETPDQVAGFAQNRGVLGLCEHGLPLTHATGPDGGPCPGFRFETRGTARVALEPVRGWLARARQAERILTLAVDLNDARDGDPGIWADALGDISFSWAKTQDRRRRLRQQREALSDLVNNWCQAAAVGFRLVASDHGISVVVQGQGVNGAIALQLMAAVAKKKGFAVCSYCTHFYTPEKRLPKATQLNYCKVCREGGAPSRVAKRIEREGLSGTRRGRTPSKMRIRVEVAAEVARIVEQQKLWKSMVRERLLERMTRSNVKKDGR